MKAPAPSALATIEAERQVSFFVKELLMESSRIATRNSSDEASVQHVALAATHLYRSGASRTNQRLSSVGGLIIGAASSLLITFLYLSPVNVAGVAGSAAALVVGTSLYSIGAFRN